MLQYSIQLFAYQISFVILHEKYLETMKTKDLTFLMM